MVEKQTVEVYLMCGGYYPNFPYPKAMTVINGEPLFKRTMRLLEGRAETHICCNTEETAFDEYKPVKCAFTYDHVKDTGYYLDIFDAVPFNEECIFLFSDVFYTENAIDRILERFSEADRNIFICNEYPFNEKGLRQGEPFGWIVKDVGEFKSAVLLCKRFQDRGIVNVVPSNWELAHVINGMGVNEFNLRKEDCLIIDDVTIDVDDPSVIEKIERRINE